MTGTFTARIIKGGALLADTRRLLEAWDPEQTPEANLARITEGGRLGKTQMRQQDVLAILRRRYVEAGQNVILALRQLAQDPTAFIQACYYEAARTDALLAAFAAGPLFMWYREGRSQIGVEDADRWLAMDERVPRWSAPTRRRVARGLLAALRDFGLLEGVAGSRRKRILPPHLSMRGFLYVALRERSRCDSTRGLLGSAAWRWYLLTPEIVRRLFLEADRLGYLRFVEAGSLARIDWSIEDVTEIPHVAAS